VGRLNYAFAIKDGVKSIFSSKGLKLSAIFYISILLYTTGLMSLLSTDPFVAYQILSLDIPAAIAGSITLLGMTGGLTGFIAAFGTLGNTTSIQEFFRTDKILFKSVNFLLGGILFTALIVTGWMMLVVPGFILAGLFPYWGFYTIRKDENFYRSLVKSWKITRGNRKHSIYLVSMLIILEWIFSMAITLSGFAYHPFSLFVLSAAGSLYITFSIASLASAFDTMQNPAED